MISKQQLINALSSLPDDTQCNISFNTAGRYSSKYNGKISGVTLVLNEAGKFDGIITVDETPITYSNETAA